MEKGTRVILQNMLLGLIKQHQILISLINICIEWVYENMQLTDLLGGTGKIPGGKVHMMFVILSNFQGRVDFDYSY